MGTGLIEGARLAGRYDVLYEAGRGGMGVVYACRDVISGDRVALKLLHTADGTPLPGYAAWFWAEARALAALDHPCIVKARDFGVIVTKAPFLVMDLVPGVPLTTLVSEVDLEWPAIWIIADRVLSAIGHAHARGIIHGDLKHTNIIVEILPHDLKVRLLDFGLAWLLRDRFDHRIDGTAPEGPMVRPHAGTVGWMAPEQIRGAVPHVGPWTDLYALGCVLYQLVTGHEPYESDDLDEIQRMHRNAPVPEVNLPVGVPDGVADFIKRLLAKRPWHRYQFAADARRVLAQFRPPGDISTWALPPRIAHLDTTPPPLPADTIPDRPPPIELPVTEGPYTGLVAFGPTRFVGRADQREQLRAICDEMVLEPAGTRRAVLLTGQAGVGKSRLAEWLCEDAHERGVAVPLRARHHKISTPLDGLIGAVMTHFNVDNADRAVTEQALLNVWDVGKDDEEGRRWVAAVSEWLRPTAPGVQTAVGPSGFRIVIGSAEMQWRVVRYALERIGRDRPILLWLDDLHLASERETAWLEHLQHDDIRFKLLIVATVVTEGLETDLKRADKIRRLRHLLDATEIEVAPMDEGETTEMLLSSIELDTDAVGTAFRRSKGIPLFALQLLHAWANGGSLEMFEGRYRVKNVALDALPATTSALWDDRIAALSSDVRRAAMAAAALGGDIRVDVLIPLLTSLKIALSVALPKLEQAQILVRHDPTRYRWPHGLLQEHLMKKLLEQPDAAQILREAAFALGSYHPSAGTRRIVRHRVTNLITANDVGEAVKVMLDFVERSWERTRDVAATLDDLAMIDGLAKGAWAAAHKRWRAEALRHAGSFDEAMSLAFSARRAFGAVGDLYNEAQCLRLLGHIASEKGSPRDGRKMVTEARELMVQLKRDLGRAQCDVVLGELDYLLGDYVQAQKHLELALEPFERGQDALGKGQCLIMLALIQTTRGDVRRARDYLVEARRNFDRIGYRLGTAQADIALAHADHRLGELEAARARAQNAFAAFQLQGTPRGQSAALRAMSMAAMDAGDLADAEQRAVEALAIYQRMGDPWGIVEAQLLIAQVALAKGSPDAHEKVACCDISSVQEREPLQHWHLTKAWLAHREGDIDAAIDHIEAAREAMCGGLADHGKQLFARLAALPWPEAVRDRAKTACQFGG